MKHLLLLFFSAVALAGCSKSGSDPAPTPAPIIRLLQVRLSVIDTELRASTQTLPSAEVRLASTTSDGKNQINYWNTSVKNGDYTDLSQNFNPFDQQLLFSIRLYDADLLMKPTTKLKADVYYMSVLQKSLLIDYSNYKQCIAGSESGPAGKNYREMKTTYFTVD